MILSMPLLKNFINRSFFLLLLANPVFGIAQELKCSVTINASQITTSDRGIFKEMENAIEQFMNSRKWTNDIYKPHEKINCHFLVTITKMPAIGNFSASVQVQSSR